MFYAIKKRVDLWMFPDKVLISVNDNSSRYISIDGNDASQVMSVLQTIYDAGLMDTSSIETLFAGYREEDVCDFLREFVELGVLDAKANAADQGLSRHAYHSCPYRLLHGKNDIWFVRRKDEFYFFRAKDSDSAKRILEDLKLSWFDDEESELFSALAGGNVKCLQARLDNDPREMLERLNLAEGEVCVISEFGSGRFAMLCLPMARKDLSYWENIESCFSGRWLVVPYLELVENHGPFLLDGRTYLSHHKRPSVYSSISDFQIGRDSEDLVAKGKAVMESIERFCGRRKIPDDRCVVASWSKMEDDSINPQELARYSDLQFKRGWLKGLVPFNPNQEVRWVHAKGILSGRELLVPDFFLTYSGFEIRNEEKFFFTCSNGMAAHLLEGEAVKRGALEVIERDAILLHWINRISPPRINCSSLREVDDMRKKLLSVNYKLEILDLTIDTVPVVMAVARGEESLKFMCGAAASETYIDAIKKALSELELTVWWRLKYLAETQERVESVTIDNLNSPLDHEALYLKPEMASNLDFLLAGDMKEVLLHDNVSWTESLQKAGKEAFYVDLTDPLIRDSGAEVVVVKVLIPTMVPITFGYGYEPLGMQRIYDFALCKNQEKSEEFIVNSYLPHFFP